MRLLGVFISNYGIIEKTRLSWLYNVLENHSFGHIYLIAI